MKSLVGETKRRNRVEAGRQHRANLGVVDLRCWKEGKNRSFERSKIRNAMNLVAQENEQTDDVEMVEPEGK